jgi:hypothetical protein
MTTSWTSWTRMNWRSACCCEPAVLSVRSFAAVACKEWIAARDRTPTQPHAHISAHINAHAQRTTSDP